MTEQTRLAITAILATDKTVKESAAKEAIAVLTGRNADLAEDKPISRSDAAKMLGVSKMTVTRWGSEGIIRRITVGGRRRAFAYSLASINDILMGKANGKRGR